jgi:hypothetical protein
MYNLDIHCCHCNATQLLYYTVRTMWSYIEGPLLL